MNELFHSVQSVLKFLIFFDVGTVARLVPENIQFNQASWFKQVQRMAFVCSVIRHTAISPFAGMSSTLVYLLSLSFKTWVKADWWDVRICNRYKIFSVFFVPVIQEVVVLESCSNLLLPSAVACLLVSSLWIL